MKTAYEILGEIIAYLSRSNAPLHESRRMIADAMEAYADEKVRETFENRRREQP